MKKIHENRPEPINFLYLASEALKEYHRKDGGYTDQWHLLKFSFANGPYYTTDPDVWPTKDLKNAWKPKGCEYVYKITHADRHTFLIRAFDCKGHVRYEIDQDNEFPREIR